MKRVDFRRVFVVGGLASLVIIYAVLWLQMITSPAERTGADFIAFYAAGRILQTGQLSAVYIPSEQRAIEESVLGFSIPLEDLNPFVHPPFILPVLALIALLPYVWAFNVWALLLLGIYLVCASLLVRIIPGTKKDKILFAGMVLFYPAFVSLLNGQDTALLLLGAAIWLYGLSKGEDGWAGVGLGLMTIRPHIALLLAIPFIFRRQRVWWAFVGTAAVLVVFSVILIQTDGTGNFLRMLTISGSGEGYKINEFAMVNLIGLLRRLVPEFSSASTRLVGWIAYACAIIVLCVLWVRSRALDERHFGLAVILSLFFAPHLHYHDLTLLLIPIACVMLFVARKGWGDLKTTAHLPLAVSLFLLLGGLVPVLKYNLPYLVMVILGLALWFPAKRFPWRSKKHEILP
jgi:hypothetical protein